MTTNKTVGRRFPDSLRIRGKHRNGDAPRARQGGQSRWGAYALTGPLQTGVKQRAGAHEFIRLGAKLEGNGLEAG